MFYLTYLRSELRRRLGRTIFTVLGLGVGVALVVAVTALGAGLDRAQSQVLGPLSGVATDLTVTKQPVPLLQGGAFGGGVTTNLAELGDPGDSFSTDTFSQTQPPFDGEELDAIASTDGVAETSKALVLQGIRQEGTVPEITAEVETGGEEVTVAGPEPITEEERQAFAECMERVGPPADDQVTPGGGRIGIAAECLPERFTEQGTFTFRTPGQVQRFGVDTPDTDIRSEPYTIAGIEPDAGINLITPEQVTDGVFLSGSGEAMVSESYAADRELAVGDEVTFREASFEIVGLVSPPLSGTTADIYLDLAELQTLSEREDQTNVILVRADDASAVEGVSGAITETVGGTNVADASDLATQVAGSLVDSGNLIRRLGFALGVVGMVAAVLIAALLTLGSVAKRTRELGTLKAIGWRPRLVVRQIVAESAAQGVLGAAIGIGLGIGASTLLGAIAPSLEARAVQTGGPGGFGLGRFGAQAAAAQSVELTAPVSGWMLALAAGLALAGGLVAGAIGAMRAARLRPADAMREVN